MTTRTSRFPAAVAALAALAEEAAARALLSHAVAHCQPTIRLLNERPELKAAVIDALAGRRSAIEVCDMVAEAGDED